MITDRLNLYALFEQLLQQGGVRKGHYLLLLLLLLRDRHGNFRCNLRMDLHRFIVLLVGLVCECLTLEQLIVTLAELLEAGERVDLLNALRANQRLYVVRKGDLNLDAVQDLRQQHPIRLGIHRKQRAQPVGMGQTQSAERVLPGAIRNDRTRALVVVVIIISAAATTAILLQIKVAPAQVRRGSSLQLLSGSSSGHGSIGSCGKAPQPSTRVANSWPQLNAPLACALTG
uniref:(northern house mosquito) hypothetical protein n=1 Tax=Culex pipiens TaxID=7175 RepID=A0A8D8FJV5_CULPI